MDRKQLLTHILQLEESQFELLLDHLRLAHWFLPGKAAPLAERTTTLFRLVEQQHDEAGQALMQIEAALRAVSPTLAPPITPDHAPLPDLDDPLGTFARFFGRDAPLAHARQQLRSGRSALLIGGRRAGKTALLRQLGDIGRRVIYLDAAAWELHHEQDFHLALGRALGSPSPNRQSSEALLAQHCPLALVIDEADRLLGHPWSSSLLIWLRWLDDTRFLSSLAFLLAGGPLLYRYRNPDDRGSPPLNTATQIFLEPLEPTASAQLIQAAGLTLDAPAELLRAVGGHPWLLIEALRRLRANPNLEAALDDLYEAAQHNFETWRQQLDTDGIALLRALRARAEANQPIQPRDFGPNGDLRRYAKTWPILRALCLARRDDQEVHLQNTLFLDWMKDQDP
jgi:hypothetical protein